MPPWLSWKQITGWGIVLFVERAIKDETQR